MQAYRHTHTHTHTHPKVAKVKALVSDLKVICIQNHRKIYCLFTFGFFGHSVSTFFGFFFFFFFLVFVLFCFSRQGFSV
jgi:hypothetical protein